MALFLSEHPQVQFLALAPALALKSDPPMNTSKLYFDHEKLVAYQTQHSICCLVELAAGKSITEAGDL